MRLQCNYVFSWAKNAMVGHEVLRDIYFTRCIPWVSRFHSFAPLLEWISRWFCLVILLLSHFIFIEQLLLHFYEWLFSLSWVYIHQFVIFIKSAYFLQWVSFIQVASSIKITSSMQLALPIKFDWVLFLNKQKITLLRFSRLLLVNILIHNHFWLFDSRQTMLG